MAIIRSQGFSLLEVLIALAIVTVALLGVAAFQTLAFRSVYSAYQTSVALSQAGAMMERLRVNASPSAREREYLIWQSAISKILPSGEGDYQCISNTHVCRVNVYWQAYSVQTLRLSALI